MNVPPSDKSIDELIADLDAAQKRCDTASNERQKKAREKQYWTAFVRLSDKVLLASNWLSDNFVKGRDEVWLDVLAKYQRGVKSLNQGTWKPSQSPSPSPELLSSLSKSTPLEGNQLSLLND